MTNERDHHPKPLTLEEVSQHAVEQTLEHGRHAPTLIAEGAQGSVVVQLDANPDARFDLAFQALGAGVYVAQDNAIGPLRQVFLIAEAWMSSGPQGERPPVLPSEDPNRKEILMITHWRIGRRDNQVATYNLVRNAGGQLTALNRWERATDFVSLRSPILDAFIDGFQVARSGRKN